MRCSKCGKEFGEGVVCQNCGVDRVTGLANYSSYGTSDYHRTNTSHYDSSFNSSPNTMVCYSCGEIIPANSEYCPYCSKELYVMCPKCGHKYSSQFPACNKCGTNRKEYFKEQKENERKERERQEAERQKVIREENERKRRQKEWEQSPEGKAELARQRAYIDECKNKFKTSSSPMFLFKLFGFIALVIGGALLVITISGHGSWEFIQNPSKEIEGYVMAIVSLFMGFVLFFSKGTD